MRDRNPEDIPCWSRLMVYGETQYTYTLYVCERHKSRLESLSDGGTYRLSPTAPIESCEPNETKECCECEHFIRTFGRTVVQWREMAALFLEMTGEIVVYHGRHETVALFPPNKRCRDPFMTNHRLTNVLKLFHHTRCWTRPEPIWENQVGQLYLLSAIRTCRTNTPRIPCDVCGEFIIHWSTDKRCHNCCHWIDNTHTTWKGYIETGWVPQSALTGVLHAVKGDVVMLKRMAKMFQRLEESYEPNNVVEVTGECHVK